jgi:two-component system NtrC family sensor kinase
MAIPRILAIDDEPCLLRTYARSLRGHFEVVTADNAPEALALLERSHPFDAVLCDVHMGGMTGFELFDEVERHSPDLARRFIWVTGSIEQELVDEHAARQPFLGKPFTLDQLESALAGVLGKPGEDGA